MGPKDSKTAVVDSELRVRGTRGLRVIDASVMVTKQKSKRYLLLQFSTAR